MPPRKKPAAVTANADPNPETASPPVPNSKPARPPATAEPTRTIRPLQVVEFDVSPQAEGVGMTTKTVRVGSHARSGLVVVGLGLDDRSRLILIRLENPQKGVAEGRRSALLAVPVERARVIVVSTE